MTNEWSYPLFHKRTPSLSTWDQERVVCDRRERQPLVWPCSSREECLDRFWPVTGATLVTAASNVFSSRSPGLEVFGTGNRDRASSSTARAKMSAALPRSLATSLGSLTSVAIVRHNSARLRRETASSIKWAPFEPPTSREPELREFAIYIGWSLFKIAHRMDILSTSQPRALRISSQRLSPAHSKFSYVPFRSQDIDL